MHHHHRLWQRLFPLVATTALAWGPLFADEDGSPSFNRDIRPILSDRCFLCHGPDPRSRRADFRFDLRQSATGQAASGAIPIVPGDVESSEMIARITSDDPDFRMPPPDSNRKPLSAAEIGAMRTWIANGAEYQPHWSLIPPRAGTIPEPRQSTWCRNAIDRFVLNRLEQRGWSPAQEADRRTLIRRLSLDLTGLPPTADEVESFVNDLSPQAYETCVDHYLQTPQFGEHMARYWLDAVRYGDTHGLHLDNYREVWPYRDWVVRAFNQNLPWDQMTTMQLAGDLLPNPTIDDLVASGYNRLHVTTNEGGSIPEEVEVRNVVDRVATTGTVYLGLTVGCAVCHDHKYDPITQRDFYSLYAFFNNLDGNAMDGNAKDPAPVIRVPDPQQAEILHQTDAELQELRERLTSAQPDLDLAQEHWEREWAAREAAAWETIDPLLLACEHGSTLTRGPGGTIEISGQNPDVEVIELTAHTRLPRLTALRLEVLLPEGADAGLGRSANANAVLSEISLATRPLDRATDDYRPAAFSLAMADHAQPNFPVEAAIDGNLDPETGWAVEGHRFRQSRVAAFVLRQPVENSAGTELKIRLSFLSQYRQHVFQRIRLAIADNGDPWPVAFSDWSLLGPCVATDGQAAWDTEFGPEHAIDLAHPVGDAQLVWTRQDFADGQIHRFNSIVGGWYLTRRISSPSNRTIHVSVGSDDAIRVWLNGQVVFESRTARAVQPDQDSFSLPLVAGDNVLLMKIVNFGGDSGFYFKHDSSLSDQPELAIRTILAKPDSERDEQDRTSLRDHYRRHHWPEFAQINRRIDELKVQRDELEAKIPTMLVMKEAVEVKPAYLLRRGEYDKPDTELGPLPRQLPSFLPPLPADAPRNRLGLAQWLIAPQHPLMARVTVNRFWQQFFGTGIVKTTEDFGSQGSWPSHPDLLDWLAVEFREHDWDVKHIVKLIVMSATYRQSSTVTPDLLMRDPKNEFLGRGPRFRLDAETIRDQALAASGLLKLQQGGPPVKPPQPQGLWEAVGYVGSNTQSFQPDQGAEKVYRRSIYTFWKRTSPPPQLAIFDAPTREECAVRRERTNTPLQALLLLNELQMVQAARGLAQQVWQPDQNVDETAQRIFTQALLRPANPNELAELSRLYNRQLEHYLRHPGDCEALLVFSTPEPDSTPNRVDPPSIQDPGQRAQLAAWTMVANVVFNLDEFVTKE